MRAPPRYPQAKGKVERFKRNFNEEYLVLQKVFDGGEGYFPDWIREYNYERPNMGIEDEVPASRYEPARS